MRSLLGALISLAVASFSSSVLAAYSVSDCQFKVVQERQKEKKPMAGKVVSVIISDSQKSSGLTNGCSDKIQIDQAQVEKIDVKLDSNVFSLISIEAVTEHNRVCKYGTSEHQHGYLSSTSHEVHCTVTSAGQ